MKKTKVGPLINNGDFKLPNGRYSPTNHNKVFQNISVFRPHLSNSILEYFRMLSGFALKATLFSFICMAFTRLPHMGQLTNANYYSNHVTKWDKTIKCIIASLG